MNQLKFLVSNPASRFLLTSSSSRGQSGSYLNVAAFVRKSSNVTPTSPPKPSQSANNPNPSIIEQQKVNPTSLDKIFLTWSGHYKSKEEIPSSVAGDVIHKARNYARIRINLTFLFLAAVLSGGMIYSGKQAAKRGESVELQNLEWHRKVNEQHRRDSADK